MSAESIFIEYLHGQMKQNQPIDTSTAASIIVSKGIPFEKTKANKQLLLDLYDQYKQLYTEIEKLPIEQMTLETMNRMIFPFSSTPFLGVIEDLIEYIKQKKQPVNATTIEPSQEEKNSDATTTEPLASSDATTTESLAIDSSEEELERQRQAEVEAERQRQALAEVEAERKRIEAEALAEQRKRQEEEALAKQQEEIATTVSQSASVIPELDRITLSYSIDLTIAQYRDVAKDIRYTLLTYIDLYKDTPRLRDLLQFVNRAINDLQQQITHFELRQGFHPVESTSLDTLEEDHPVKAYQTLFQYYTMLQALIKGLQGEIPTNAYNTIFVDLQRHLSSLRTQTPLQVQEYKQLIRLEKNVPTQHIAQLSHLISRERNELLTSADPQQYQDLTYYIFLASYDNNPMIVIEDPTLEQLCAKIGIASHSPIQAFLSLSPEQRLQFIQIVHSQQPFDSLSSKNLAPILPMLEKFIEDNQPIESGCKEHFTEEIQALQSDLKRFIVLYGEAIEESLIGLLQKKYTCTLRASAHSGASTLSEEQIQEIKRIIDEGLAGQLTLLNQLAQHYPSIVSDDLYSSLLRLLSQQYDQKLIADVKPPSPAVADVFSLSSLELWNGFVSDHTLSEDRQKLKEQLIQLRDYFNHFSHRQKVFEVLDQIKKRHHTIDDREKASQYADTVRDLLSNPEDAPLRQFLLNFLDLYGSFEKIPSQTKSNSLSLSYLRHLPKEEKLEAQKRASFFLLDTGKHIGQQAVRSQQDQWVLNEIEYLLYSPQKDSVIPYLVERIKSLVLPSSFKEYKTDLHLLREELISVVQQKQFEKANQLVRVLHTIIRSKIMKDPFVSSGQFRTQRLEKRSLAKRVVARLPPLNPLHKEILLWYILKPWMTGITYTEYRHFEYFIALPAQKKNAPAQVQELFGKRLPSNDLGFISSVHVYRPTISWWNYILDRYHSPKCNNVEQMIQELTIEGGTKQRFIIGLFAPGYTARILTAKDLQRECKWFDTHFTSSQTQYVKWLNQPASHIVDSLRPYLESLIRRLFQKTTPSERSLNKPREDLKVKAFIDALFAEPRTVSEVLRSFFLVYTFLSSDSIVYGFSLSILSAFEKASPQWYPYLLRFSPLQLFPELTLVDPSIKDQILDYIQDYVEDQIKHMYSQAHPDVLPIDLQNPNLKKLQHLLEHEVRPYVQTKWCPIDKSIAWYLSTADEEDIVKCVNLNDTEAEASIPTEVIQSVKAQLAQTEPTSQAKDLTVDVDIEMTAIRHFTEIIRDTFIRSGEFSASRLAREISKSHPDPVTGKQLPVEPIRQKLQDIAEQHYHTLLAKVIDQYLYVHPELIVQLNQEKQQRYRRFAILGYNIEAAENDFTGRKRILQPLFDLIKSSFQLDSIEEDRVIEMVMLYFNNPSSGQAGSHDLSGQAGSHDLSGQAGSHELAKLCGYCQEPLDDLSRLSYFYIKGIPEPEHFCSLECADKRMSKFQEEPHEEDVEIKPKDELFVHLLQFYPTRGVIEQSEGSELYIPEQDILLNHEEALRQLATTIQDQLPMHEDLTFIYRAIVARYHSAYERVLREKQIGEQKGAVELVHGCDITLKQVKDFIKQHASRYYDQIVDGQFHFVPTTLNESSLISDFYLTFPMCEPIPEDQIKRLKEYSILKRLANDIERAFRMTIIRPDLTEDQILRKVLARLDQIYRWRYLKEAKSIYPYLSDADHLTYVENKMKQMSPQTDLALVISIINRYSPIGNRFANVSDFLREMYRVDAKNIGRNRLTRLFQDRKINMRPDIDRYQAQLGLILQIAKLFPKQLLHEIQHQRIIVRTESNDNESNDVVVQPTVVGFARTRPLIVVKPSSPKKSVKKTNLFVSRSKQEHEILENQMTTLEKQIEHEIHLLQTL